MSHHGDVHKCHADKHHDENHLCCISARQDIERIKKIVKDSQFFCKKCGRAAREKDNLCDPSKI